MASIPGEKNGTVELVSILQLQNKVCLLGGKCLWNQWHLLSRKRYFKMLEGEGAMESQETNMWNNVNLGQARDHWRDATVCL